MSNSSSRQRQLKKDEAIRKKLEQDFLKKNNSSARTLSTKNIPGTVSALRPGQALTVRENMFVIEAAQLMAAKRCDCVLVINQQDQLCGIFTAKDIAYRLVAENLDAKITAVTDIMTKNPLCVTFDTSATEALNLMVTRGFRHLPVCNDNGDIFGLLDITKCLYSALEKMERAFGSSASLYDALQGVEQEWSVQLANYMEDLRDSMTCPRLESVLDVPAKVKYRTNVREIAVLMKELGTTAVLVTKHQQLAGIFTSKDIVLRVIAAGLKPENCTVVRVMTPNPDTASPDTTVLDALKLMNEGHYLNLPVVKENGSLMGMVDVLKLTYVTLEQMGNMGLEKSEPSSSGPMWGRFWDSFQPDPSSPTFISPQPSTSLSQLKEYPDISPNESASMVNVSTTTTTAKSDTFTFKLTCSNQKTHRIVCKPVYKDLLDSVSTKLHKEWVVLSYLDDENDQVLISSDSDVHDAVQLALKTNQNRVKLIVQDKKVEPHTKTTKAKVVQQLRKPKALIARKSMLLPAAISFLGVVVTGVLVLSRVQQKKNIIYP